MQNSLNYEGVEQQPLQGIHREGLPRLLDVRHSRSRAAAYRRRPEAGSAPHHLRDERARPVGRSKHEEVGPHGRRRHRQVPSARRLGLLRGHGADGAGPSRTATRWSTGRATGARRTIPSRSPRCATPNRGCRAFAKCCCRNSVRARSTGSPNFDGTHRGAGRCCRRACRTCCSTARPASPSACRPTSRRTISRSRQRRSCA